MKAEMSSLNYRIVQQPISDNLIHYRNIFADPSNFIKRKVDYSKMKIFDEKYRKESERLNSLQPMIGMNPDLLPLLAKTGFYYRENPAVPDQVRCIYCQGNLSNWKKNDIPTRRHKFNYPTCPYIIYLNVGNEPLGYDFCGLPNEDPDAEKPKSIIDVVIVSPQCDVLGELMDDVDRLDVEKRQQTFIGHPHLKSMALRGFHIVNIDGDVALKCCCCLRQTVILKGIELLGDNNIHMKHCRYMDVADSSMLRDSEEDSKLSKDFCDVEYSLISQEVDARMDMRSMVQLLQSGFDRERLRVLLELRLKAKGKDFESLFELVLELRKTVHVVERKRSFKELSLALSDFSCVVCLDRAVEVVFLPCGHLKTCTTCADLMVTCPVCRLNIVKRVKRFRFNDS